MIDFKNGSQENKTLSLTTDKCIALYARMLKKNLAYLRGYFVCFLGVLRGERAHCKNNGRGSFNREDSTLQTSSRTVHTRTCT